MAEATPVATNGFNAPNPGPAAAPQAPGVPALPAVAEPSGNGNPIKGPNQQPGFVPPPAIPGQEQPPQQPAQPANGQPNTADLVALLAAALKETGAQPNPDVPVDQQVADAVRPAWMKESANDFDVSTIDDPIIKSMATVLKTAGKDLDLDRVIGLALDRGDVSLIDAAYVKEKAGDKAGDILEIARSIVTAVDAKSTAITAEVHEMLGGEANYSAAVAAFNKNAPSEVKLLVSQMLDSTNEKHIKAGAKLVAEYGRASGLMIQPGAPLVGITSAVSGQGQGLSAAEFKQELGKLDLYASDYNEQYQALHERRALGKSTGK